MAEEKHTARSLRERIGLTVRADSPADLVTALVQVEEAGVEQVWFPSGPLSSPDLLTTLAAAAVRTTHLKLGTYIIQVSTRHPALLAQQVLSFNSLAPNRLRLGLGTGSPAFAKSMYGVEIERPLAYLREYVQVLRPLLEQGEVHHQGQIFTTDTSLPGSAQVPIYMAALGPGAFRLAGEVADGVLPAACPLPYLLDTAIPALKAAATTAGRSQPTVVANVLVALTEDRNVALEAGRKALAFQTSLPNYRNMFAAAGFSTQEMDAISDSLIESMLIFGDESKLKDRFQQLLASGIDELNISPIVIADAAQEASRVVRLIGSL
jgi:F420-dependent oxidoreductase-like protein